MDEVQQSQRQNTRRVGLGVIGCGETQRRLANRLKHPFLPMGKMLSPQLGSEIRKTVQLGMAHSTVPTPHTQ